MNSFAQFPDDKKLLSLFPELEVLSVNSHIHTPYSFSAFNDIPEIFSRAIHENISCLGINDFYVTDGYDSFHKEAIRNGIMPLFNIEFIGLMKEEQQAGIRINDPSNPGRCYFCGKGLDYPFHVSASGFEKLERIIKLSQEQVKAMISRLNDLFSQLSSDTVLDYDLIKTRFAKNLVRERHLAKAVRLAVFERFSDDDSRAEFLSRLFGGRKAESSLTDIPGLENEIRGVLLKSGGNAFVEEDEDTFLNVDEIIEIILDAGGIPCYPVLLDDKKGGFTEYEYSSENLYNELLKRNTTCIELIPGRNDLLHLERFVKFFHEKGFVILMGTEHNTPQMIPLTCDTRGGKPLSLEMQHIAYEGACVIASHQYLKTTQGKGYPVDGHIPGKDEKDYFIRLGNALIHYHKKFNVRL